MVASFKAFKEYHIYMGLKKKPNSKHYWMSNSMFHCLVISNIFIQAQFQNLSICLHVTNPIIY
jgi:hypothetical protein